MNWTLLLILVILGLALVVIGYLVGTASATPAGPAEADITFAAKLAGHHALAVRMASMAGQLSTDPEIRQIAFEIETDRIEQTGRVKGWSDVWQRPVRPAVNNADSTRLKHLTGREFDIAFLQAMRRHDRAGIELTELTLSKARTAAVRAHAKTVRALQESEIEVLDSLLAAHQRRAPQI
ncbi:DUF305 domain-containing protein [Lentzea sp. HUAS TT2]|uniref:DUF305 domain-containing protein n=1 Tax=Lentzea sp. HUAS TT2 TaxID=3447454 RepID=UPI003F6E9F92